MAPRKTPRTRPTHRTWICSCGKVLTGNLAKWSHGQKCDGLAMWPRDYYRTHEALT